VAGCGENALGAGLQLQLLPIEGIEFAVVNVNTFENVEASELDSSTTDFDGESVEARLARRKRNWIPRVSVEIRRV
jgi:hypothetical protein